MSAAESRRAASIRWRQQNPDLKREYDRAYYRANKLTLAKQQTQYRENEKTINPVARMIRTSKHRAKKVGLDFNIDAADIVIPSVSPVLGIPLLIASKMGGSDASPSIDRIDNNKGYIKGNVRVISNRANKLKSNATVVELELILQDLKRYEHQNAPRYDA